MGRAGCRAKGVHSRNPTNKIESRSLETVKMTAKRVGKDMGI